MGKGFITRFKYECEINFNSTDGTSFEIPAPVIRYIIIERDFEGKVMPLIYIGINLEPKYYDKMIVEQGISKVHLNLFRIRTESTSTAPKTVIYDEFDYFMTDDPDSYTVTDKIADDAGQSYKRCIIGIAKLDLQKYNQKTFEGVFKDTNSMSLVQSATSDMKMVIQPFHYNTKFKTFVCPKIGTVGQFISYLNSKSSFYKGSYTYFMDFDKTYLRSNDGSYIDAEDGDFKYIAFDIRDLTAYQTLATGIVEDKSQDAYIIYVTGNDAKITIDRVTSSNIGTIEAANTATGTTIDSASVNTEEVTNIGSQGSTLVRASDNPHAATNMSTIISENATTLSITKMDMDSRIFTPNKQYLLCNYEDNPKYCGVYYLVKKEEIYLRVGDDLRCSVTLVMKKCADFAPAGSTTKKKASEGVNTNDEG